MFSLGNRKKLVCGYLLGLLVGWAFLPFYGSAQNRVHMVYYEGTDHELHVYRIYGKEPGKTLLLIGGIQGDEPGGFLSVDLYADLALEKGNLIVVPRANFQSILLNRRKINEDMNRKFAEELPDNYEAKIVKILKSLIQESDCVLNSHDGSGFFSETWKGEDRNPKRYGQSIIADCEIYINPKTGERIELGKMARSVVDKINKNIKTPEFHFHFNNHRTREETSFHKEQRKSATYYALYSCGVPAFGIETSKSLPLEIKVRHHNFAINAFMEWLGILPETPGLNLEDPELRYLVISVNDSLPVAVENGQTLFVSPGDTVHISHIEANYERGLSADILKHGTLNDLRKKVFLKEPAQIVVRKDYYPCGKVFLKFEETDEVVKHPSEASNESPSSGSAMFFKLRINGIERIFPNFSHVNLIRGDRIEIMDVIASNGDSSKFTVNFKGYVGNPSNNTGEDRGFVIDTGKALWERYSLQKRGKQYQVVVTDRDKTVGKLFIGLEDPVLNYILVRLDGKRLTCLTPGKSVTVKTGERFELLDIRTNISENSGVEAFIAGPENLKQPMPVGIPWEISMLAERRSVEGVDGYRLDICRGAILIGSVRLEIIQERRNSK